MKASAECIDEKLDWFEDLLVENRPAPPAFRGTSKAAGAVVALSLVGVVGVGTIDTAVAVPSSKTALVTIRDRGPYISGRIVDLSPATAQEIGLDRRTGVTKVEVAPIAVPMAGGKIKLGDGILAANSRQETNAVVRPSLARWR